MDAGPKPTYELYTCTIALASEQVSLALDSNMIWGLG